LLSQITLDGGGVEAGLEQFTAGSYNEGSDLRGTNMPAYEYECAACSRHFERRQKMSEPAVSVCPECGGSVKRLISGGAGAISKGSGASSRPEGIGCNPRGACCGQGEGCCGGMACEN
jgi:putative FmdB family regulatory protein